MFRISFTFALLTLFITTQAFAAPYSKDAYWQDIRQLTLKGHNPLTSYRQAREHLMQEIHIHKDHRGYYLKDVYCGIIYRKRVSPDTIPNHNELNTEHTWPQSRFNKRQPRAYQKSDLHHLYPSDSRTNGKRGNHRFGEFKRGRSPFPYCSASQVGRISQTGNIGFEPPQEHKGNVARSLFYFSIRYDIRITSYEEFVLRQWNVLDPVDSEEIKRNDMVESIQGNRNPFVDDPQLADIVENF